MGEVKEQITITKEQLFEAGSKAAVDYIEVNPAAIFMVDELSKITALTAAYLFIEGHESEGE